MCIRDSSIGAFDGSAALVIVRHFHESEATATVGGAIHDDPVSYTHLRAHETVLDLVCRLLLEKKKSDTTQLTTHSHTIQTVKKLHQTYRLYTDVTLI